MHGLLLLITLASMLPQGEVLPPPMTGLPVAAPVLPNLNSNLTNSVPASLPSPLRAANPLTNQIPAEPYKVGWGTDPQGVFSLILQISPDSVDNFAKGEKGSELAVDIPQEIRGLAQRVIVRIGSGPVERIPANPQSLSRNSLGEGPQIANAFDTRPLDSSNNGAPVTIDRAPSRTVSLNASPQQPPDVLPNTGSGSTGLNSNSANSNILPPLGSGPNFPSGNFPSPSNLGTRSNPSNLPRTDNFSPTVTPSTGNFSGTPSNYATSNNPALGLPGRNLAPPYLANNQNGLNSVPSLGQGWGSESQNMPTYGQNANLGSMNPFPTPNPISPFSQGQVPMGMQQQQPPPYAQNPYFVNPNPYLQGPSGRLASATPRNPSVGLEPEEIPGSVPPAWNAWLPFTLLLSIVINVYQGMWMGHLRARYRQLLGDMRGVPVSEYAGN